MEKLTKKNEDHFFGQEPFPDRAFVRPGKMFVADKRYEYTQIQEMAVMGGIAARRVNPADMVELKENDYALYKHAHNYWQTDAKRLFICISRKEYDEILAIYNAKWKKHSEKQAIEGALEWFDRIIQRLDGYKEDVVKHKKWFQDALEGKREIMKPINCIDSAMGDLMNLVNNLPFRDVTYVVRALVEAGIHEGIEKKDD